MKISVLRLWAILALALVALLGCQAVPTAKDGDKLKTNQGLLAFHVTSNADAGLSYLEYSNTSTFNSQFGENMFGAKGVFQIKAGETFYVVPVEPGDYMFSKFTVHSMYAWMQANNRFRVKPNSITYIGHIQIKVTDKRFGLQVFDRELEMRTYLADAYPRYFQTMALEKSLAELRLRPQ